ncbi:hypothetical protein HETIRDRAFT_439985 [Heterobasidion irregulare TC 32-1]|uniref:Uncharacterized protein n=1 Tax=Heterobasidion irregulare (strain TC 32-1) TaxID=747525 RepID=W4K795_HETIT|nr:uncharacterized protein HETIRDRAFT_439985 [Heterobasidion irregulare TC 32-1]ETW81629.1 hypothetical protein HETIRDRAFT_439985 [Heterobasidion irregulare TC 32-1]
MNIHSNDQMLHDRINLGRLVKRLETSVAQPDSNYVGGQEAWVKSQSMLQKIKFARKLLSNLASFNEMDLSSKSRQRNDDLRRTLDRLESTAESLSGRLSTPSPRPSPLLPSIPLPLLSARGIEQPVTPASAISTDGAPLAPPPEQDLLLSPADDDPIVLSEPTLTNSGSTLFLPSSTKAATTPSPAFLQNSSVIQHELSAQLAQMAGQLRRNAVHFSEVLARDQAIMSDAEEKIGANFDVMKKERVRLRDHRGKSMGTTCITLASIIAVVIAFIWMFFVIRLT